MSDSATPCTVALQAPLSMEFSRQGYWNRLPFPTPGDLPSTGIKPASCVDRQILTICYLQSPIWHVQFSSVQFSHSVVSDSLRPHESQHTRPPCPSPTPGVHSDSRPSSQWCHPASHPLSSPSPPAPNPSQHQSLFQWVNSSHEVAKVLEFQL